MYFVHTNVVKTIARVGMESIPSWEATLLEGMFILFGNYNYIFIGVQTVIKVLQEVDPEGVMARKK